MLRLCSLCQMQIKVNYSCLFLCVEQILNLSLSNTVLTNLTLVCPVGSEIYSSLVLRLHWDPWKRGVLLTNCWSSGTHLHVCSVRCISSLLNLCDIFWTLVIIMFLTVEHPEHLAAIWSTNYKLSQKC